MIDFYTTPYDARKKLDHDVMKEFLDPHNEDDPLVVHLPDGEIRDYTANTIIEFFKSQEFKNIDDDAKIGLYTYSTGMIISGFDYKWYNSTRRINKLFGITKKNTRILKTYHVGISYENAEDSTYFEGTRSEAQAWLNKYYGIYSIRERFQKPVYISLDENEWKTLEEYVNEGRLKI